MNRNTRRTTSTCSRKNNRKKAAAAEIASAKTREQEALAELEKALAEARLRGQNATVPPAETDTANIRSTTRSSSLRNHQRREPGCENAISGRTAQRGGTQGEDNLGLLLTHCRRMSVNRNSSKPSLTRTSKRWTARA